MGAGASSQTSPSSLNRLRKALIMRAYNIRKSDETLDELFKPQAYRSSSGLYISVSSVKKILSENAPWVDLLFDQVVDSSVGDMEFNSFIHFLETGNMPTTVDPLDNMKGPPKSISSSSSSSSTKQNLKSRPPPSTLPPGKRGSSLPPSPPINVLEQQQQQQQRHQKSTNMSTYIPPFDSQMSSIYPGVIESLHLHTLPIGIHSGALVPSVGLTVSLDHKFSYKNPSSGPTRPLWRKREVVKQERTVEYTTIDANGVTQELTETEITTTEVLHMECRETGEFAHRETTNYEQSETFNDELVAEEKGNEEYVHMKSIDDEYEFLESNMPKKEAPPEPDVEPGTPCSAGGGVGGEYEEYQNSPSYRAQGKSSQDTAMHELNVSDDEGDRYGGMRGSSPHSSDPRDHFRRGGSGASSNQKFDNTSKDEYDSPPSGGGGGGGGWQSMGSGGNWVPPANTDYDSELLENSIEDKGREPSRPPVGVRRPDLFAPASGSEDKHHSYSRSAHNDDDEDEDEDEDDEDDEDVNSTSGHGGRSPLPSRHGSQSSREHSQRASSPGEEIPQRNSSLDRTSDTLQSDMFQPDDNETPTPVRDKHFDNMYRGRDRGGSYGDSKDCRDQGLMFANLEPNAGSVSAAAQWGSEDDID